jgi:glycosyltransferase involved in cell wall biosynthesis
MTRSANKINFKLSLVVPVYNEAESIESFLTAVEGVLNPLNCSYEIVFVDDGSTDKTWELLSAYTKKKECVRALSLSRNFGKERALTAGLDACVGDAVIPMDVDLQDPPELIPQFIDKWLEGYDVVYGVRNSRGSDPFLKRVSANGFYRMINLVTDIQIPANVGDYRLMDRCVIEALKTFPERNRFMKGLFAWVGFRQTGIPYERPERYRGSTKWNYWRLWNFAIDGFTGFTTVPLRLWSYFGVFIALISFLYALFLVFRTALLGVDVPGYASLMVVVLFLGGVQLITAGILGEYLGRLFREVKQRPIYLVRESAGFAADEEKQTDHAQE